jgi:hypothetical protein
MAIVVRGDAMSPDDVAKAFAQIEQVDAVVSTIGGTPADPNADSQARTRAGARASARPRDEARASAVGCGVIVCSVGALCRAASCAPLGTRMPLLRGLARPGGCRGRPGSCTMHADANRAASAHDPPMHACGCTASGAQLATPAPGRAGQHQPGGGGGAQRREALCAGHLDRHRRQPRRPASAGAPARPQAGALCANSACVLCSR